MPSLPRVAVKLGLRRGALEKLSADVLVSKAAFKFIQASKRTRVVLFKCDWFDPTIGRGCKIDDQYGIVEVNIKRKLMKYEPFILASQSQQVYFAEYPTKKKNRADWRVICKIEARNIIKSPNLAYQEDEMSVVVEPIIDDELQCLGAIDVEDEEHLIVDDEVNGQDIEVVGQDIEELDFESQAEDTEQDVNIEDDEDIEEDEDADIVVFDDE
ncbi:TdcA1-ORF2 protein [Senna tora]|uniref:TdcA1-ORF2 protein n=1 Tax=Senna tora TaxID=362788 RepID=A0A834W6Y7_9FABA|nr:TdcA1-ORF2 protein [Senna tora]